MLEQTMWRGLTAIITAVLVSMTEVCVASPLMGPFRVNFKSFTNCPPPMDGMKMINLTLNTFAAVPGVLSSYYIDGSADFFENYDDSITASVSLTMLGKNNQLRSIRKMQFQQSCTAMLTNLPFMGNVMKAAGAKPECPMLAGHYAIHNQSVTLERIFIKEFLYGRWRMDVELLNSAGQNWACMRLFADTVPR